MNSISAKVEELIKRGITIRNPVTVDVDESVDATRIGGNVVIHQGCRIRGKETSIGPGCVLGEEGPVTIEDCQLAEKVSLKGGYFSGSVFLDGVVFGSGAHVRAGTLLEENVSCAHTVGLKQTMLMPFVTLGSLINFCDCLMAGGTSRKDHSEVGSSYIHFNYTPNQDKATASLIGDVPRGVLLDQHPIFLGGQGGMVGPSRIEYGAVIAAGTICRRDVTNANALVIGGAPRSTSSHTHTFEPGAYGNIGRSLANNFAYIGNLHALLQWYLQVRSKFMLESLHCAACHKGAVTQIRAMIEERIKRLSELAEKMPASIEIAKRKSNGTMGASCAEQWKFMERWPELAQALSDGADETMASRELDFFVAEIEKVRQGKNYLETIASLGPQAKAAGRAWLENIVNALSSLL
jgi:UDP-N-acetylglucosamine/UDP-N-acetylgalactosamine diphosphorylase